MTEVSCLSQHLCSPLEGHLNSVYKVFRYRQNNLSNNAGKISFDPACVHTDEKVFEVITRYLEDWKDFYPDAAEAHLRKNLEPLGEPVTVWVYVGANHAGNLENRRFHSGILIYVKNSLINLYNKIQNIV